jgi:hypothetical protein
MRRPLPLATLAALLCALPSSGALAFDQMDSAEMAAVQKKPADLGDLFVFEGAFGLAFGLTVNTLTVRVDETVELGLDPEVVYQFKLDTNGDDTPDLAFQVVGFEEDGVRKVRLLEARGPKANEDEASGDEVLTGPASPATRADVLEKGGVRLFVGARKEPLYFDFRDMTGATAAAARFALGAYAGGPSDGSSAGTFGATNATLVLVEVPKDKLPARFRVWATVSRNGNQEDRVGKSMTSALLLPDCPKPRGSCRANFHDWKQAFNNSKPSDDVALWSGKARAVLRELGSDPQLATTYLLPDVLDVDVNRPIKYPNGRTFADDAVGATLHRLDPKAEYTDKASPEKAVETTPYLAPPVEPNGKAISDESLAPTRKEPAAIAAPAASPAPVAPAASAAPKSDASAANGAEDADRSADARIAVVFSALAVLLSGGALLTSRRKRRR